jgi:hypothetical protein
MQCAIDENSNVEIEKPLSEYETSVFKNDAYVELSTLEACTSLECSQSGSQPTDEAHVEIVTPDSLYVEEDRSPSIPHLFLQSSQNSSPRPLCSSPEATGHFTFSPISPGHHRQRSSVYYSDDSGIQVSFDDLHNSITFQFPNVPISRCNVNDSVISNDCKVKQEEIDSNISPFSSANNCLGVRDDPEGASQNYQQNQEHKIEASHRIGFKSRTVPLANCQANTFVSQMASRYQTNENDMTRMIITNSCARDIGPLNLPDRNADLKFLHHAESHKRANTSFAPRNKDDKAVLDTFSMQSKCTEYAPTLNSSRFSYMEELHGKYPDTELVDSRRNGRFNTESIIANNKHSEVKEPTTTNGRTLKAADVNLVLNKWGSCYSVPQTVSSSHSLRDFEHVKALDSDGKPALGSRQMETCFTSIGSNAICGGSETKHASRDESSRRRNGESNCKFTDLNTLLDSLDETCI